MAAHAHGEGETSETQRQPVTGAGATEGAGSAERAKRPSRPRPDFATVRGTVSGFIASVVRWIGLLFALILVVHVILVIGEANPTNGITTFIKGWADAVALGFQNLFAPQDAKVRVLVNYGTAAVFWLVVSSIVATLIRRLGGEKASS